MRSILILLLLLLVAASGMLPEQISTAIIMSICMVGPFYVLYLMSNKMPQAASQCPPHKWDYYPDGHLFGGKMYCKHCFHRPK